MIVHVSYSWYSVPSLHVNFRQLPPPPQLLPAATDTCSACWHTFAILLSLEAVPSLGFQPNFFLLDDVAEELCGLPITLPWLQSFLSLLTLLVFVKVCSYYCMCQNLAFFVFTIHSPALSVVCHIQKPGQAFSTVKYCFHLSPLMIFCVPNTSTNNGVYFSLAVMFLSATASLEQKELGLAWAAVTVCYCVWPEFSNAQALSLLP